MNIRFAWRPACPIFPPRWSSSSADFPTTTPAPLACRSPLALGVSMSGMRRRKGMAAWRKALHLRMRRLRQADLGHGRHNHAWFKATSDRMVLGRLSHGHPFEWDFGAAIAKATRARLLQVRVAAVRQAAPRHGRAGPHALAGVAEVDETEIPLRTKADPVCGGGGRSPQGKMLVAGAVEVENDAPGRIRLAAIQTSPPPRCMASSPPTSPRARRSKPTDGRPMRAPPTSGTSPMSSAPWPRISFCPGSTALPNAKTWALGVYHGLRRENLQGYLDEFAFRFNRRRTRHAAFHSLLGIDIVRKPLTYNMLIIPEAQG